MRIDSRRTDDTLSLEEVNIAVLDAQPAGYAVALRSGMARPCAGCLAGKRISEPVHGPQESGLVRIVADCRANLADQLRQTGVGDERLGPDCPVQLCLRQGPRAVIDQKLEQVESLWRDVDRVVTAKQLARIRIEPPFSEVDLHLRPQIS
jgi:hypothetical protein